MQTGKHLIIDASGIRSTFVLTDITHTYNFLASIPNIVRLKALCPPYVVQADDKHADGITGFGLLTTSHFSIHTWSNGNREGQVHLDVFSCKDFDEKPIIDEFRRVYQPTNCDIRILKRL